MNHRFMTVWSNSVPTKAHALMLAVVFCLFAGCSKEAGPDPKMLSQGDTPEISKANNAMEDFMKNQGKSQTPKK